MVRPSHWADGGRRCCPRCPGSSGTCAALRFCPSVGPDSQAGPAGSKSDEWFDHHTGQMGGEDAVRVVQDLLGHAQHFDFAQVSDRIPKLDLPDLAPFFRLALRQNRRQLTETGGLMAFKTPEPWQRSVGVRPRYDDVHFDRK